MKKYLLFSIFLIGITAQAQHLFPEKFKGCNTDMFSMESDTTNAKISGKNFIDIIVSGFDEETKSKIEGVLTMQIIVDLEGKSCLLSLENGTTIRTKKLNLKKTIDGLLLWSKPTVKVSPIVQLSFSDHKVGFTRLGLNGKKGLHELTNGNVR